MPVPVSTGIFHNQITQRLRLIPWILNQFVIPVDLIPADGQEVDLIGPLPVFLTRS